MPSQALDSTEHLRVEPQGDRCRFPHILPMKRRIHESGVQGVFCPEFSLNFLVLEFRNLAPSLNRFHYATGLGGALNRVECLLQNQGQTHSAFFLS